MKLVCGCVYQVTVITKRERMARHREFEYEPRQPAKTLTLTLTYCGGGIVDADGHRVGGGVWGHHMGDHRSPQYADLNVLHIEDLKMHDFDDVRLHGQPDPTRPPMTLKDMSWDWLWRTAHKRKARGHDVTALVRELYDREENWYMATGGGVDRHDQQYMEDPFEDEVKRIKAEDAAANDPLLKLLNETVL